jgi:hypothetical protein
VRPKATELVLSSLVTMASSSEAFQLRLATLNPKTLFENKSYTEFEGLINANTAIRGFVSQENL